MGEFGEVSVGVRFPTLRMWDHKLGPAIDCRGVEKWQHCETLSSYDTEIKHERSKCIRSTDAQTRYTVITLCHNLWGHLRWIPTRPI